MCVSVCLSVAHIQLAGDEEDGEGNAITEATPGDHPHDHLDLDSDHQRTTSRFSLLPPPSLAAASQRSFRSTPYSLPALAHAECTSLHMYSAGRRLVRTTCPSCESTVGSSQSSAGSYYREATAAAAALTLSRCGSNCSHAREYSSPHSREYSSGATAAAAAAPPLLPPSSSSSLPPRRGGAQDYSSNSASCDVRGYPGGGRDVRDFVTSRREARGDHHVNASASTSPSGRRRGLPAAVLHQAVRAAGCPSLVRPSPLSPYLPHHSGIPFPPAIMSAHHMCSDPFSCALHAAGSRVYHPPGHAVRLYAPVGPTAAGGRLVYDSDGDNWGSLRSLSVMAVRGSSSSDPNPSDTSLECDCCCGVGGGGGGGSGGVPGGAGGGHISSNSDSNVVDSNRSTYGSSEPKDSSDVSSYDSRVYQARGSGSSADERGDRRRGRSSSSSSPPIPRSLVAAIRASCPVSPRKTRALHRPLVVQDEKQTTPPLRQQAEIPNPDTIVVVHEPEEGRVMAEEVKDEDDDDEGGEEGVCDVCSAQGSSGDICCPACGREAGSPLSVLEDLVAAVDVDEEADFDGGGGGVTEDRCLVTKRSREEASSDALGVGVGVGVATPKAMPVDRQDDGHATAKPPETSPERRERLLRPLLPSATVAAVGPSPHAPNARGFSPGDSGLGHRRVRSASCRRHTASTAAAVHRSHSASHPRHNHSNNSNNTAHAYANPRNVVQVPSSRTRAGGTALSVSSGRHHRSHGNNPGSSSSSHHHHHHNNHHHHHHSHRQGASASGSPSRRSSSSSSRRYMWAMEHHRAGLNPGPVRTRSYHHQYLGQCDICARQQALYLAAAQLHNSVGGGGGGGGGGGVRGGGGVPHVMCDPMQGVLCRLCHQRGRVDSNAGPKHSMVLFTEPQGEVMADVGPL